jgi:GTP-binding protein EngB required for normal cell division
MPGYGFAYASDTNVQQWQDLMRVYIQTRKNLRRLYLLLDARHGAKLIDTQFMEHLDTTSGPRYTCVLTKCDLVPPADLARRAMKLEEIMKRSMRGTAEVLLVSTKAEESIRAFQSDIERVVGGGGDGKGQSRRRRDRRDRILQ